MVWYDKYKLEWRIKLLRSAEKARGVVGRNKSKKRFTTPHTNTGWMTSSSSRQPDFRKTHSSTTVVVYILHQYLFIYIYICTVVFIQSPPEYGNSRQKAPDLQIHDSAGGCRVRCHGRDLFTTDKVLIVYCSSLWNRRQKVLCGFRRHIFSIFRDRNREINNSPHHTTQNTTMISYYILTSYFYCWSCILHVLYNYYHKYRLQLCSTVPCLYGCGTFNFFLFSH